MRSYEDALELLAALSEDIADLEDKRERELRRNLQIADKLDRADRIGAEIVKKRREQIEVLENLVSFPPRHAQYAEVIEKFWESSPGLKSVFIMTKYPDGKDVAKDGQLQRVIDSVTSAVKECGFVPHLAGTKKWHANLWENIEIYMLACCRGIAIVESQFNVNLNPNVAMEWGWLRGMGRPVLYLVEKQVQYIPPDVVALINDRFDWNNPELTIRRAVHMELTGTEPPVPK
jgi:hypothetical protein